MKFKMIKIKNFRNFENVEVDLANKNLILGMNDIGKTNFLYALRFLFDRNIRRDGFVESDYFKFNTNADIEITVNIDISDEMCNDNKKIRCYAKGALIDKYPDDCVIKLVGKYNTSNMLGNPLLLWGSVDEYKYLSEVKSSGIYTDIDKIFELVYIDSYVDSDKVFSKVFNNLLDEDNDMDEPIHNDIKEHMGNINDLIASLSSVQKFQKDIDLEYNSIREEDINIEVKSEAAIKGLYSSIKPYIKCDGDNKLYPTSGDGRRKILSYSLYNLLSKLNFNKKIVLFLVEEPENHLHKSMQISLSKNIFQTDAYKYSFITTHSPSILHEMDNVNLIRVYNEGGITSKSEFFIVPDEYKKSKQILNQNLSEALFCNKVLLVEGMSEKLLFDAVMNICKKDYEINGTYIMSIEGIGFKHYHDILTKLNITTIVKTDNDLRKPKGKDYYNALGLSRCNSLIGDEKYFEELEVEIVNADDKKRKCEKRQIFKNYESKIKLMNTEHKIYLSEIDLEHDMLKTLGENVMKIRTKEADPVKYLQSAKKKNMNYLLLNSLLDDDLKNIYNGDLFQCLKEL